MNKYDIVMHFRCKSKEGELLSRGGLTIGAYLFGEDTNNGRLEFHFGIARCSKKDNYVKRYGRTLAVGRAYSRDHAVICGTREEVIKSLRNIGLLAMSIHFKQK